jgi:cysteinyl-tRNA synthetase
VTNTTIKLYDTLRRRKVDFEPIDPDKVRMYVCGPTVYDFAHIGNARPVIVFDVLFRLLRTVYGAEHVIYARNITDVDDKINARAAEEYPDRPLNEAISEVTQRTTAQFHADIEALGVLEPTIEPRCTGHIPQMVAMIETLIAKGYAYAAEGHVLLDTTSVPNYGELSGRSLDEMIAGARVEVAPYKRHPADSVLWKPSSDAQPGWDSRWGRGRPGWHIECSAMAAEHLGEVFDIHGGGIDLTFPHHENELAQSRSAHGTDQMANVWMHNGFLQVEGEKMSKSVGNFFTINELLDEAPGEAIRLTMLATHYRQPFNWTMKGVAEARRTLDHWYELTEGVADDGAVSEDVHAALCDDLNTPKAIAALHELRSNAAKGDTSAAASLLASARAMGLLQADRAAWLAWRPAKAELDDDRINELIAERLAARAGKNFARSDEIRDELLALGIQLKDGKDPSTGESVTTWELK